MTSTCTENITWLVDGGVRTKRCVAMHPESWKRTGTVSAEGTPWRHTILGRRRGIFGAVLPSVLWKVDPEVQRKFQPFVRCMPRQARVMGKDGHKPAPGSTGGGSAILDRTGEAQTSASHRVCIQMGGERRRHAGPCETVDVGDGTWPSASTAQARGPHTGQGRG